MYAEYAPAPTDRVLVVLSGGLDSTTALALARRNTAYVAALTFDYGQTHIVELNAARAITEHYQVSRHTFITSSGLGRLIRPISYDPGVVGGHELLPKTWKPGRNMVFLSYAMSYAYTLNASIVVTGIHSDDTPGYPDCRREFLVAMEKAGQEALASPIALWCPLLHYTKRHIVELGTRLGVPYEKTWTCYLGGSEPCHRCDACKRREEAFMSNNLTDPLLEKHYGNKDQDRC